MTNLLPDRDLREPNSSAVLAVYWVLRRQPWKTWAARTWDTVSRLFLFALFAISLTVLLATAAHARTYEVFTVDVPFKFDIGHRTFRPGQYQFIFVGPGLLALRDSHAHVVASLVTRSIETGGPLPTSKLVFRNQKKQQHLAQIWIENHTQVVEILGEELSVRQSSPPPPPLPASVNSLFERSGAPGFKQ